MSVAWSSKPARQKFLSLTGSVRNRLFPSLRLRCYEIEGNNTSRGDAVVEVASADVARALSLA